VNQIQIIILHQKKFRLKWSVTDGPYAELKEIVGGFVIVSAESVDDALALAKGCPALASGGKVEVRDIMDLEGM